MAALLQEFGLLNDVLFTHTGGQTLIPGRSKLVTLAGGPEGVLLKRISSLSEAFQCGGLLLYNRADPSDWRFFVGETLREVLQKKRLNHTTVFNGGTAGRGFTFRRVPAFDGHARRTWSVGDPTYATYVYPGGDFTVLGHSVDYFDPSIGVGVLGVVTGANVGYGNAKSRSLGLRVLDGSFGGDTGPVSAMSFMASIIPMSTTFESYLRGVKAAALALVPSGVRQYYESTFNAALAASADKAAHPTISVPTFWRNGSLAAGQHRQPKVSEREGAISWASSLAVGGDAVNWSQETVVQTWNNSIMVVSATTKARILYRSGFFLGASDVVPMIDEDTSNTNPVSIQELSGTVGGLKIGLLRDSHVFFRSLVDMQSYQDVPSPVNTLDKVVNYYIDPFEYPDVPVQDTPTTEAAINSVDGEFDAQLALSRNMRQSIYQMGTLPLYISKFSDEWDVLAKAAAKG